VRGRARVGTLVIGLMITVTAWARIVPGERSAGELRRSAKPKATGFFHKGGREAVPLTPLPSA